MFLKRGEPIKLHLQGVPKKVYYNICVRGGGRQLDEIGFTGEGKAGMEKLAFEFLLKGHVIACFPPSAIRCHFKKNSDPNFFHPYLSLPCKPNFIQLPPPPHTHTFLKTFFGTPCIK